MAESLLVNINTSQDANKAFKSEAALRMNERTLKVGIGVWGGVTFLHFRRQGNHTRHTGARLPLM